MGGTVTARPRPQPHELVRQLQFPPGYHFVPTEAELVDVYLRARIEGRELPLDVVNEIAVLDWQPGSLVGKQTPSILSLATFAKGRVVLKIKHSTSPNYKGDP